MPIDAQTCYDGQRVRKIVPDPEKNGAETTEIQGSVRSWDKVFHYDENGVFRRSDVKGAVAIQWDGLGYPTVYCPEYLENIDSIPNPILGF